MTKRDLERKLAAKQWELDRLEAELARLLAERDALIRRRVRQQPAPADDGWRP